MTKIFHCNKYGYDFYSKYKKDTLKSIYVFGPLFFIATIFYIYYVLDSSWFGYFFSIPIFILYFYSFYYLSYFRRGEFFLKLGERIIINDSQIEFHSFGWFGKKKVKYIIKNNPIIINEIREKINGFYPKKGVKIKSKDMDMDLYLFLDFFNESDIILKLLYKKQNTII